MTGLNVSGAITLLAILFTCIFPKKYPLSTSTAAVEMRTLRGYEELQVNPNVDPQRDGFLDWRFWRSDNRAGQEIELPEVSQSRSLP